MPKSKKSDTVGEACPSIDHDQDHETPLGTESNQPKKSRAATKSDKSRKSNRSGRDTSHDSSATLKPADAKKSKTTSKSRKSRESNKADEGCHDTDHEQHANGKSEESRPKVAPRTDKSWKSNRSALETSHDSSATLNPADVKKSGTASKARKSRGSNKTDEGFYDTDHEHSSNDKSKESKKPMPSPRSRKSKDSSQTGEVCPDPEHEPSKSPEHSRLKIPSKSRKSRESNKTEEGCPDVDHELSSSAEDPKSNSSPKSRKPHSNDTEEQCPDTDHDPSTSPGKTSKYKTEERNQDLSEPQECHHADHQQPVDSPKSSTLATKSDKVETQQKAAKNEPGSSSKQAKQSSSETKKSKISSKSKMMGKLKKSKFDEECVDGDHGSSAENPKKDKKPKKEKKPKGEKTDKKDKKSGKAATSEDNCVETDHWPSSSDAKKLKKLIESREGKAKRQIEKGEKSIEKMEKSRTSSSSKSKSQKDCTCVQEHDLADCDVVQTNDGAASRKVSKSDLSTAPRTPAQAFPRGIQIMAKNTNTLEGGFPYPKELAPFEISKEDWARFCAKLTESLGKQKIAYAIEKVLDICAEEDVKFFRPKGFIMRLDMPGEEQYGLDIMDIYHSQLGNVHTDNFTTMPPNSKEYSGAIKHKHHVRERTKDRKHLETVREKAFRSTRLMLDPIIVLQDPHLATQRGWARWIIACNQAQKLAAEAPPKRMDNKPWYGYFPARWDRWPPSKHLYYDRFRGSSHALGTKSSPAICLIPDYDSMDQRGNPYTSPVIPCDEVEFAVLHPDQQ
ncbi:hypothetical protein DL98DRAFT_657541 [Cadophora sp. DSE1049]|nr:hypothetical protein DL98DRAFT_657541 [Cadophora sp. DSE1049]